MAQAYPGSFPLRAAADVQYRSERLNRSLQGLARQDGGTPRQRRQAGELSNDLREAVLRLEQELAIERE